MFSFLKKRNEKISPGLPVDIHSHLLAQLDDGVNSLEEAENIVSKFISLGYKKLITTPHIMSDAYRNEPNQIRIKLKELQAHLASKAIKIEIEAAAEYYLDESFIKQIDDGTELLTFGQKYILFETNYLTEPYQLKDVIFKLITSGYQPVLAHPERYHYMTIDKVEDLKTRGVLMQVNTLSIIGYYSRPVKSLAEKIIDQGWVDLLGSDCHHLKHVLALSRAKEYKYFKKAIDLPLLNYSL